MEELKDSQLKSSSLSDERLKGQSGDASASCTFFIKKPVHKFAGRGMRGRRNDDSDEKTSARKSDNDGSPRSGDDKKSSSDDETSVVVKKRRVGRNPMIQSTGSFRDAAKSHKYAAQHRKDTSSESEKSSSSDYTSTDEDEKEEALKRAGASKKPMPESKACSHKRDDLDDESPGPSTKGNEASAKKDRNSKGEEIYTGMKDYKTYKKEDPYSSKNRFAPKSAPDFLKGTVVWDYKPDLCKDYKETGYCGFGDSCIFLHDRTDYKHGWQIELEMAKGTYGDDDGDADKYKIPDSELEEDERIPFKCLICRETFKDPVVTKCKHYFCEKCALDQYRKSTRCYVCQQQTGGVFNPAKAIIKRFNLIKAAQKADAGKSSSSSSESDEEGEEEKVEEIGEFGQKSEDEDNDGEEKD